MPICILLWFPYEVSECYHKIVFDNWLYLYFWNRLLTFQFECYLPIIMTIMVPFGSLLILVFIPMITFIIISSSIDILVLGLSQMTLSYMHYHVN